MRTDEIYLMDEEDPAALLLSDELMDDEDEESEIYEMGEGEIVEDYDEYEQEEMVSGTPQSDEMDASFYIDDDAEDAEEDGLVQENPFEPVYPASAALLGDSDFDKSESGKGIVLEAVSLDNILPAGSRRRRN